MTTLSIVLPLYNARHLAPQVLPPIERALQAGTVDEVIVVDDGSSDAGPEVYREAGCQVIPSGGRLGPGGSRNVGVKAARGDLVLFIDSDVVMRDDVPELVRQTFAEHPDCVALFGSYDDSPASPGLVSQYRNLLHHWVHQQGREEASTFWAGCGAVRRAVYQSIGGFDLARYPYPSIEDIELGFRLLEHGRILLRKDIQCTHLKHWTLRSMVFTDVFRRALPWSRLLQQPDYQVNDLNVNAAEKGKAVVAALFWGALLSSPFFPPGWFVAMAMLIIGFLVNRRFFALVRRRNGPGHMLAAVLLHQLYYLYSTTVYVYAVLEARLWPRVRQPDSGQSSSV